MSAFAEDHIYTIADIEALPEGQRAELVDGRIYMMASPESQHEDIIYEMGWEMGRHIREKGLPCKVLTSNVAVYLFDDSAYLLPDLKVICDLSKYDSKGYHGAPDFIVEVLSPSTRSYDMVKKLNWYMDAGVKEYWMVDPPARCVYRYVFIPEYDYGHFTFDDDIPLSICPGEFGINLGKMGF